MLVVGTVYILFATNFGKFSEAMRQHFISAAQLSNANRWTLQQLIKNTVVLTYNEAQQTCSVYHMFRINSWHKYEIERGLVKFVCYVQSFLISEYIRVCYIEVPLCFPLYSIDRISMAIVYIAKSGQRKALLTAVNCLVRSDALVQVDVLTYKVGGITLHFLIQTQLTRDVVVWTN